MELPPLIRVAVRNVVRSPRRFSGVAIFTAVVFFLLLGGNILLSGTREGVRRGFVANLSGDLCIFPGGKERFGLFGDQTPVAGEFSEQPWLEGLDQGQAILGSQAELAAWSPGVLGLVELEVEGHRVGVTCFGVDTPAYHKTFPVVAMAGLEDAAPGRGIWLGTKARASLEAALGRPLEPGEDIQVLSAGASRFQLRLLEYRGSLGFSLDSEVLDSVNLMDRSTMEALLDVGARLQAIDDSLQLDYSSGALDLDSLFGDGGDTTVRDAHSPVETGLDLMDSLDTPAPAVRPSPAARGEGQAHFIMLRLNDPSRSPQVKAALNQAFGAAGLAWEVRDWDKAVGGNAIFLGWVVVLFNLGMIIILATGFAIVVNTLVISMFERRTELGTMRALGAARPRILGQMLVENLLVLGLSGTLGMVLAIGLAQLVGSLHLALDNQALRSLMGSNTLLPLVRGEDLAFHFLLLLLVSLGACGYPAWIAARVPPVQAMAWEQ